MSDPVSLDQLFGAFVNQGTVEDAATWMACLSKSHPELAVEFEEVLTRSIEAATLGERWVIDAVNRSGYQAQFMEDAKELCVDLLNAYEALHAGNA